MSFLFLLLWDRIWIFDSSKPSLSLNHQLALTSFSGPVSHPSPVLQPSINLHHHHAHWQIVLCLLTTTLISLFALFYPSARHMSGLCCSFQGPCSTNLSAVTAEICNLDEWAARASYKRLCINWRHAPQERQLISDEEKHEFIPVQLQRIKWKRAGGVFGRRWESAEITSCLLYDDTLSLVRITGLTAL